MAFKDAEEKLLKEICARHGVDPQYLRELFELEKEYADRNMSKRRGLNDKISDLVKEWALEEKELKI